MLKRFDLERILLGGAFAFYAVVVLAGFRTDKLPAALVILPVIITVVAAVRHRSLGALEKFLQRPVLVLLVTVQCSAWLVLIFVDYYSVSYNIMDTGSFAHVVANVADGRGFYNSLFAKPA